MRRIYFIILFLSGFIELSAKAQQAASSAYTDHPLRIEIPVRSANETYRVIPCGKNGLIMFFRSLEIEDGARTNWYFTLYDTNFRQIWVKSVPLLNDQIFQAHQNGKDTLVLLFVNGGKSKKTENSYGILQVVMQTGTMILNNGILDPGAAVDGFGVQKGRAWLGANIRGQAGKIVQVGLKQGIHRSFPLGTGTQIAVLWMEPDTSSLFASAIVGRQISKKISEYYLVRYDTNGRIIREVLIGTQSGERTFTQARVATSNEGTELLAGSYGQNSAGSGDKNRFADESTGLFASPVRNGTQASISFYNFLELQNAASIVGENDIMNLKKKALKKNKSLSEYSLDYSVLLHDIRVIKNQFLLTAEFFSPQYHTESFTDFDFYGRPYTNSYSVFDGYRFFNAVVAGFDQDGKLLWDNNIEIRNLVSFELSPKVVTFPTGNDLVLCYVSDGKIGSKIIRENNVVEKLDFSAIDLLHPDDKLLNETRGLLMPWYGDYFLSCGYQEIKNIALETNNKRLVYYVSKIRFEN